MMAFRFIHSADIHLDSPLRSLALRDETLADLIGAATRTALRNIVDLAISQDADALLLAGDLYDGEQTSMKTATFFALEMQRLAEAGVKVFIIRGNHDAESKITNELLLPDNVTVFKKRSGCIQIEPECGMPIAVHGMSFFDPKAPASLLPHFRPPVAGTVNIGLLHTSLTGADGHNDYAPCSIADLVKHGYRYWALGHLHKRTVVDGDCTIVMPGNPQGRDINEAGPKSATLVTISDDGAISCEEHLTSIAEFSRVPVSLETCPDWAAVVDRIEAGLEKAREAAKAEHLVCRLHLTGATAASWELRAAAERLKADADVIASRLGKTSIEKIENASTTPGKAAATAGNALAELVAEMEAGIVESDAYSLEMNRIARDLLKTLPPETQRTLMDSDEDAFRAQLSQLAREGVVEIAARLQAADGKESN
jgi:DNA repair exonuclease SbcCD nuclease subunit